MNILFTCAGRRTYLLKYFKENLSEGDKIVATDMSLTAPALQVADMKLQVPAVYDSEYVNITLRICEEQRIDALFSLNDLGTDPIGRTTISTNQSPQSSCL